MQSSTPSTTHSPRRPPLNFKSPTTGVTTPHTHTNTFTAPKHSNASICITYTLTHA